MYNEIKSIELIFENCEYVKINNENIGCFYIDDIKEEIARYAINYIAKYKKCSELFLELSKEADKNNTNNFFDETSLFERFKTYGNISSIEVEYTDGSVDKILVPWGEDEYINEYQSHYMDDKGNLYICISKEKVAKDIYNKYVKE